MFQTAKELASELNCREQAITQYLCRSDFAHIVRKRKGNTYYYQNLSDNDKNLLKKYIYNARKRSGHAKQRGYNKTN